MKEITSHPLVHGINQLQAAHWQHTQPTFHPGGLAANFGLIHIPGITRFWDEADNGYGVLEQCQEALLNSLYTGRMPWAYIIAGRSQGLALYYALPGGARNLPQWTPELQASFPGCVPASGPNHAELWAFLDELPHVAALTGNPAMVPKERQSERVAARIPQARLERVMHAMNGADWAYLVLAEPIPEQVVRATIGRLAGEERETVSAYMRPGTTEADNNPLAKRYVALLQAARTKYEEGEQTGMWRVQTYLLAARENALQRGMRTLVGAYAGPTSQPQPLRVQHCERATLNNRAALPYTNLTTSEAAQFARLPGEEFSGYTLRAWVRFGVSPMPVAEQQRIAVGAILDNGGSTGNWFEIGLNDLCKHALVAGFTGAGKTCTCQYLLSQLWEEHHVPWLVIEPSLKTEYRRMLASRFAKDLRVFTLGDETGVPLRINPLEVMQGVHVQTHIDGLSALFNSAFSLVTPMPDVLTLALHRVYEDFGWDLTQGTNPQGYGVEKQPRITDLIRTIRRLVDTLGYDAEVRGNIRAGLETRLTRLTLGGKGAMLDSDDSAAMRYLLEKPAILEMSAIGDDDETAFVVAALLLRLAEYRQAQGASTGVLRHVTLLEEAHRLLRATPELMSHEVANPRGQAVEAFCRMLTEMRAYGEGVIIVDQIPAKLARDAVKSTNLKLIHRLVAEDDRQLVGAAMNLTPQQQRHLATLGNGQCAAYAEGRDTAYLLKVPNYCEHGGLASATYDKQHLVKHMHQKTPLTNVTQAQIGKLLRLYELKPGRPDLPPCPGCAHGACPDMETRMGRRQLVHYLLQHDLSAMFAEAANNGWHELWDFGCIVAGEVWGNDGGTQNAYCVLMTIAGLAGYKDDILEKMRRNLNVLRQQHGRDAS